MSLGIDLLARAMVEQGASDLHCNVGYPPKLRKSGRFMTMTMPALTGEEIAALARQFVPDRYMPQLSEKGNVNCAFEMEALKARFRVAYCRAEGQNKLTIRRLPSRLLTMDEIGLPQTLKTLIRKKRGMFLVTGPTGSGKTTSLASMILQILQLGNRHIYRAEDPVEYRFPVGATGLLTSREIGGDTPDFEAALHDALRHDPDVIVIGELRSLESIRTAMIASETGHLVLGSLHTSSAPTTVERLISVFPKEERDQIRTMLSMSLLGVLCQQLVPAIDGSVVAAFEFMVNTPAIANKIREGKTFSISSDIQTGRRHSMRLLDDHLFALVEGGRVNGDDVIEFANDPFAMAEKVAEFAKRQTDEE